METISNVSYTSAHVTGKVSSPGCGFLCFGFSYTFEYSTDQENWTPGFTETLGGAADEKPVNATSASPRAAPNTSSGSK